MMRPRDNPFKSAAILSRITYIHGTGNRDRLLADFAAMRYRGAILGGEGRGKSTLLGDLEVALQKDGYEIIHLQLTAGQRSLVATPWPTVKGRLDGRVMVCLDGAEQMSRVAWHRFRWACRKAGGLLITSHVPGLAPTLIELDTSVELFRLIVGKLLDGRSLPEHVQLDRILVAHQGNMRLALRELYDIYSYLEG